MDDYSVVAEELSLLGEKIREFDNRLAEVERVNARLEDAALTTARALAEISTHWDAVYEAIRRARKRPIRRPSPSPTTRQPGGVAVLLPTNEFQQTVGHRKLGMPLPAGGNAGKVAA